MTELRVNQSINQAPAVIIVSAVNNAGVSVLVFYGPTGDVVLRVPSVGPVEWFGSQDEATRAFWSGVEAIRSAAEQSK